MPTRPTLSIILLSCSISVGLLGYAHHHPNIAPTSDNTATTTNPHIYTVLPRPKASLISVPYIHHFKHLYRT